MIEPRTRFEEYLQSRELASLPHLMGKFDHFLHLLSAANKNVNLVSRNIPEKSH